MRWSQGYAPPNSDRREAVLTRKRLEYVDCVSQYYEIPDIERTDEEINMLRQVFFGFYSVYSYLFSAYMSDQLLLYHLLVFIAQLLPFSLSHGWYWYGDVLVGYYVLVQGIR